MFVVRQEQLDAFREAGLARFESEMVNHSKQFSPRLCKVLGEEQLRVALRQAMSRAAGYGFTNRGPMRLYIELAFLCGSDFDTDPQYPGLGDVLRDSRDQMVRAETICDGVLDYQERVTGQDNRNVRNSLAYLSRFARQDTRFVADRFEEMLLEEMQRAFPQKVAYVGEQRLRSLIRKGRETARGYGFDSLRAEALIVVLMFAFGHGCTADPLYPWISQTLQDDRIVDAAARARRLEKKALTWLDHVLGQPRGHRPT